MIAAGIVSPPFWYGAGGLAPSATHGRYKKADPLSSRPVQGSRRRYKPTPIGSLCITLTLILALALALGLGLGLFLTLTLALTLTLIMTLTLALALTLALTLSLIPF